MRKPALSLAVFWVFACSALSSNANDSQSAMLHLSRADLMHLLEVNTFKIICDTLSPGFKAATSSGYSAWRRDRQAVLEEIEALPQFQAKKIANDEKLSTEQKQEFAEKCARLTRFFIQTHPDPKFATPQATWDLFLESLRNGQREVALDCLAEPALNNLGEIIRNQPLEFLIQIGTGYEPLRKKDASDDHVTYTVLRNGQLGQISLARIDGEWKILSGP